MDNSPSLFDQANAAASRGDKLAAKHLLYELVYFEPCNKQAWRLLSKVVEDPIEVAICLRRALAIDKNYLEGSQRLAVVSDGIEKHYSAADGDELKGRTRKTGDCEDQNMHDPQFILAEAKACIKRGDRVYARKLVDGLLFQQANSEQVWLLLAELVDHENERADCLRQALAINPHNQVAQQNYDELLCRYPELVELDPARVAASLEIAAAKKVEAAKRQKKVRRLRKLRRQK